MSHAGIGWFAIVFFVIFGLMTIGVLGVFVFIAKKIHADWKRNSESPLEYCSARVVAKRPQVSGMESTATRYYATFEFETGERRELSLSGADYGLLAEGDEGRLGFQGTWFRSFARKPMEAPPVMAATA
jgi:hypothetical protein